MAIPLNDNIKINAPKPSDPRYFAPDNTPWASIFAVEAGIPLTERHPELTVDVMGVEYWWKDGAWVLRESDLVHKTGNETIDGVKSFKKSIKIDSDEPLDAKYLNGKVAYASLDEANTLIPIGIRSPYLTIVVQGAEYWWVGGAWVVKLPDLSNKADLVAGKVPSSQLPSYVDDVIEAVNFASLPTTGEVGKIYITLDTNKTYRWTGSVYVEISVGVTDHTALQNIGTNTHAQIDTHIANTSNPHSVTKTQVGLSNVDNTSDASKPISNATQIALNDKTNLSGYLNIVSSATPVTLTASSPRVITVSGTIAQTIILPVTSTLSLGHLFTIINNSSNTTTVQSSGGNALPVSVQTGTSCNFYCILTSGTTASSWQQEFAGSTSRTGNGGFVYSNSPFLATPSYTVTPTHTAGTNAQGSGTISSDVTVVTSTPNNPSGVTLVSAGTASRHITIINKGTNPINIYPASGTTIDALGVNNPYLLQVNAVVVFRSTTATQWYSESAIVSDAEMQTGTDNAKNTTALRIATWFTWIKTQAQTWAAKQTFTLAPRYSSTTASQFLRVDANKDLVSVSEASDTEMQAGTENTKPTTALRIANWFTWRLSQPFTFSNLIGVGVRIMQVNSAGDVSAPYFVQEGFVTDSDVITAITGATYNAGNNFTATLVPANGKVFNQGQWYKNLGVLYYSTADNQSSRITLS